MRPIRRLLRLSARQLGGGVAIEPRGDGARRSVVVEIENVVHLVNLRRASRPFAAPTSAEWYSPRTDLYSLYRRVKPAISGADRARILMEAPSRGALTSIAMDRRAWTLLVIARRDLGRELHVHQDRHARPLAGDGRLVADRARGAGPGRARRGRGARSAGFAAAVGDSGRCSAWSRSRRRSC